jgi:hypothetical protein
MKELEQPLKLTPDTQLVAEYNKEYTLKMQMAKQRGLILFAVDPIEMKAEQVTIRSNATVGLDGKSAGTHRAAYDPTKVYVWAINSFNALRKVERDLNAFVERQKERSER